MYYAFIPCGHLVDEPIVRPLKDDGALFMLRVRSENHVDGKPQRRIHSVKFFAYSPEYVAVLKKQLHKDAAVFVFGTPVIEDWTDHEGNPVSGEKLKATTLKFLFQPPSSQQKEQEPAPRQSVAAPAPVPAATQEEPAFEGLDKW